MRRSGDIRWGELRLGLLIFLALGLFLWASIQGGTSLFRKETKLYSSFANVQGVVSGAAIWFQGVEVGSVKSLDILNAGDSSHVLVTFVVKNDIVKYVRRDSRVRIQALNVFGEKFMEVTPGTHSAAQVQNGDTLASDPPTDIAALMAKGEGIVASLDTLATDLKFVMARVRRGEGTLGRLSTSDELYVQLASTVREARSLTTHLDASQAEMRHSLVTVTGRLDALLARVDRGEGTLGKLANDDRVYDHLASASARLDSALGRVERGEGSVGKLSTDEKLYENLEQSLGRLDALLKDIQKDPKKYFKFSVF
jgi:phospholipid/cholesterol/gamma-HCH transport system substrate-binding protein